MKRTAIITAMAILAGCASVRAADGLGYFADGNKLYRECSAPIGAVEHNTCLAYIRGIADAMEFSRFISAQGSCIPDHVQLGQVIDVTRAFLRDHPESRHRAA